MIIGNPQVFAIEHSLSCLAENLGFQGIGFFALHLVGCRYGVVSPDATCLALSLQEVNERISHRGTYVAPFLSELSSASEIAECALIAYYAPGQENKMFFGLTCEAFNEAIYGRSLSWHGGDASFDDGSHMLQIDCGDRVRLIGFRAKDLHLEHDTLRDLWMITDEFYQILIDWRNAFEADLSQLSTRTN